MPKVAGSSVSGGSESFFRSDFLEYVSAHCGGLSAVLCYPSNSLCSQRLELPGRDGLRCKKKNGKKVTVLFKNVSELHPWDRPGGLWQNIHHSLRYKTFGCLFSNFAELQP
jgi:hypothetical protein